MSETTRRSFLSRAAGAAGLAAATPLLGAMPMSRPRAAQAVPGTASASGAGVLLASRWRQVFSTSFTEPVALGHFPQDAPGWGSYAYGSPDTATNLGLAVGGIYDPATTTWVSGGQLHVRQWRGASGPVHCGTPFPLATDGVLHGRFIEVSRVSQATVGYKSAHMLWGERGTPGFGWEVDSPENNWAGYHDIPHSFFHAGKFHHGGGSQLQFSSNVAWTDWHTWEIRWQPGLLQTYCDGDLVGSTTSGTYVPTAALHWRLQNESSMVGAFAAPHSSAQIDTSHVEYWAWTG